MMKTLLLIVALLVPSVALAVPAEELVRIAPERMQHLLEVRRAALAAAGPISFADDNRCPVFFDVPSDVHPARHDLFGARYNPYIRSFTFNPRFYAALNRWIGDDPASIDSFFVQEPDLRVDIDHELGHQWSHDVARRTYQYDWFMPTDTKQWTADRRIGLRILMEGVATYCERLTSDAQDPIGLMWLPTAWSDPEWYWEWPKITQEGGYSLVKPILDQYGERGLIYMLSHQLPIPDGNAYDALTQYQQQALQDLAQ